MSNQPPHWPHGAPPPGSSYGPDPYGPSALGPTQPVDAAAPQQSQPAGSAPYGTFSQPYVSKQFDPDAVPQDTYTGGLPRQQDPAATPLAGYAGLGTPPPPRISIDDFGPRRDRRPLIIVGLTALVVVVAIVAAIVISSRAGGGTPGPTPTAPPPQVSTPAHTPNPNGQGVAFTSTNDHADGYWEIKQQRWDATGVLLQLSVAVDNGSFVPVFFVFNNDTNAQYRVDLNAAPAPAFPRGTLAAPQTYTGQVYITMPHVEGTLIMVSAKQTDPISALPIKS